MAENNPANHCKQMRGRFRLHQLARLREVVAADCLRVDAEGVIQRHEQFGRRHRIALQTGAGLIRLLGICLYARNSLFTAPRRTADGYPWRKRVTPRAKSRRPTVTQRREA